MREADLNWRLAELSEKQMLWICLKHHEGRTSTIFKALCRSLDSSWKNLLFKKM
jgi:hypothetical protein